MTKITRENIGAHLFDRQLEMIGKTRVDVIDAYRWRLSFSMTRKQYIDFHTYAVKLMMKTFRCPKSKALGIFEWYWAQFGMKIKS